MKINRFEDIIAWQKSKELTLMIYETVNGMKDYALKDQIQRASVSIMNNIAEGFERRSSTEFRNFLNYAKGSCGEVRSMLYLLHELKFINDKELEKLFSLCVDISKLISGLMKSIEH